MNAAVLGIGNIGKFHIREYLNNQCQVVAIMEPTLELVKIKQALIKKEYGISVNGYSNLDKLLSKEDLDAASVCTPSNFHYNQVKTCLKNNLNVLCEKPFILGKNNLKLAEELIEISKKKNKILSVNTQWPSVLEEIKSFIGPKETRDFYFFMEQGLRGPGILTETLPHANSMLIKLLGKREIKNIKFMKKEDEIIILKFDYVYCNLRCKVKYEIKFKTDRPRKVKFSINNKTFEKNISDNDSFILIFNNKLIKINDPFKVSLKKFINSIKNKDKPLISSQDIMDNLYLQNQILKKYYS